MQRRRFIEICVAGAGGCAASPALAQSAPAKSGVALQPQKFDRTRLVTPDNHPIKAASLLRGVGYVFNYPYVTTPCFLLRLPQPAAAPGLLATEMGDTYTWPGGAGPDRSIVAYSAICAHKLAYPSPQVSFIGYRDKATPIYPRGNVIGCCAEKSVYDPSAGARVLGGPAPQPLAAILIEHDAATDELFAVGTFGGHKFKEFFEKYEFKLTLESGSTKVRNRVGESAVVKPLAQYSRQTAQC